MRIGEKREALIGGIGTRIGTHASGRDDVVNYFQEWFLARFLDTHSTRPYPSSICGYRATPTDVSPIANLRRIIMPVHRLWSPRTRRYADLISCLESGLSQWIMGLDTAPLSCSLISFSQDLLSSFIGRSYSHAISIFKIFFSPLSSNLSSSFRIERNIYDFIDNRVELEITILVNLEIIS